MDEMLGIFYKQFNFFSIHVYQILAYLLCSTFVISITITLVVTIIESPSIGNSILTFVLFR